MVYVDKILDEHVDMVATFVKTVKDTDSSAKRAQIVDAEVKPVTGSSDGQ